MKYFLIGFFGIIFLTLAVSAFAHNQEPIQQPTSPGSISIQGDPTSLAIAMGQIDFYWSTTALQIGVGMGNYSGSNSAALGIAQKPCESCPLLRMTAGQSENHTAIGLGATWVIK